MNDRATAPVAVELRHLRYFLAVFEELHFGRAAERLHIAQPPLSQAIRKLENELGVRLFERTSRVVAATDAGRALAEEARRVLAAVDVAVAESRRAGGVSSTLRVGCIPHLPIDCLLRFLGALHRHEPGSPPQVTHLPAVDQIARLARRELDVAIFEDAHEEPELETEPLFAGEELAVFLPTGHPLAARQILGVDDLRAETLVIVPREADPALSGRLEEQILAAGYRFRAVHEAGGTSPRDLLLAVAAGHGVALGPFSLRDVSEAGSIVVRRSLVPRLALPDTVVAWHVDSPRHLRPVLAVVRELARELRGGSDEAADGP